MAGVTLQDGKVSGPGEFSGLWAMNVQDAVLQDFTIDKVPAGEKPQLYADQRIILRRGIVKNVRASAAADHVEGLHVAGVQGLTIEDVTFQHNDVMQLFLTVWVDGDDPDAQADPTNNIVLRRVRLDNLGVDGSNKDALGRQNYWLIHYHENLVDCPGSKMIDCQVRMAGISSPRLTTDYAQARLSLPKGFVCVYDGQPGVMAVPNGQPWPAFPGGSIEEPPVEQPPVEQPPVDSTLEARVTAIEEHLDELVAALAKPGAPLDPAAVKAIKDSIAKYQKGSSNIANTDTALLDQITKVAARPAL